MKKFPINIITNLSSNTEIRNLILEIRSEERIATLTEYGFSSLQIDKIRTNLTLDTEKQKKTIIFSHISDAYDTITCFFPSVSLMDDRTGLSQHIVMIPISPSQVLSGTPSLSQKITWSM